MKKMIITIIILLLLLPVTASADEKSQNSGSTSYDEQMNSLDTKSIEEFIGKLNNDTNGYAPPIDFKNMINGFKGGKVSYDIKDTIPGLMKYFFNEVLMNTKLLGQLLVLAIICGILQNLEKAFQSDAVSDLAYYACYLVLIAIIIKSFTSAISIGKQTVDNMADFMTSLLPTLLVLLSSVGGFASVSVFDPIIMFAVEVTSNIVKNFIMPLILMHALLSIVNNLSDAFQVKKLAGLVKQVCVWTLGFVLTLFVGIITVRGTAAKTLDQVTAKGLKFAVDNFIPVVGKCLSDAISTIAGYTLILKDAVSTVGLIAFVLMTIFPLIKIISMIFIYKLTSALIEPVSDKRIVECLNDVGNSMTLIFVSVLAVAVLFFIMVTIIAATGKAAVMGG